MIQVSLVTKEQEKQKETGPPVVGEALCVIQ
jgi:hypothetical protein